MYCFFIVVIKNFVVAFEIEWYFWFEFSNTSVKNTPYRNEIYINFYKDVYMRFQRKWEENGKRMKNKGKQVTTSNTRSFGSDAKQKKKHKFDENENFKLKFKCR